MATTKELDIIIKNPKGSDDNLNSSTRYSVTYNYAKQYALSITPCMNLGYGNYRYDPMFAFSIPLIQFTRRNAKKQAMCEEWLKANAEAINSAFLARGKDGVKEAVRDLFHVA